MLLIRYLILVIILSFLNISSIQSQEEKINIDATPKILLNGKEYYLHVVQRGEGLYRISINYGVSQHEILEANDDLTENLGIGQIIRIPVIKGRNNTVQELNRTTTHMYHTVEKGHTAYFISRKYNIPLDVIYENNPGTRDGLIEGSILKIPVNIADNYTSGLTEINHSDSYFYHTVESKETLFAIAREYNSTVDVIIGANPALRTGILAVGSVVRIPRKNAQDKIMVKITSDGTQKFIQGESYLYHSILPGQTFYSISRQYQVEIVKIQEANPGVSQDDLKPGYVLRIPRDKVESDLSYQLHDKNLRLFTNHKVKRRETLYGISREYHVDMETIKTLNPKINFNNLEKGTVVRIPTDAWFASRTATALTQQQTTDTIKEDLKPLVELTGNCAPETHFDSRNPIKVALLFPFAAKETTRFTLEQDTSKMARILPASASRNRVFTEFYSGMLLALDTLKKQGISVELSVFDISPDTLALKRVLNDRYLAKSDLIIGPALAHELPLVSEFSRRYKIPLVYPMSNTNPELRNNPYLFHINTPDSLLYKKMTGEIIRQSAGANLIVIWPPDAENGARLLASQIKKEAESYKNRNIIYVEYRSKGDDLNDLQLLINKDGKNVIVVPTVREAEVSKIIPILSGVKEKTKANMILFGMPDWLRFQTIDPEDIHNLNGSVFSSFGIDYNKKLTNDFIRKYRKWFHTEPHAISPYFQNSVSTSGYSRYGIWGYDVTNYFVSALFRYGNDFDICLNDFIHQEVQFNFEFRRFSNWGGYYNSGLFLIKFNSDFTSERIPINDP